MSHGSCRGGRFRWRLRCNRFVATMYNVFAWRRPSSNRAVALKEAHMHASSSRQLKWTVAFASVWVWLGYASAPSAATEPGMLVAQPTTYTSPSGVYSLFVDPSERMGGSSAMYRFSKDGEEAWSDQREYTLRAVSVTDRGFIVGIAYRSDQAKGNAGHDSRSYFHMVILGPRGETIVNEIAEQHPVHHASPQPHAQQVLINPETDRAIFRVWGSENDHGWGQPSWWVYEIPTGELIEPFDPKTRLADTENVHFVLDARAVPATPLILVHWYLKGPDYKIQDQGGRFTLFDQDFKVIWSLDVPNDYAGIEWNRRWAAGGGPAEYFARNPAILDVGNGGQFCLRRFADDVRLSFKAERHPDGTWRVRDEGHEPFQAPGAGDDRGLGQLPYLGTVQLGNVGTTTRKIVSLTVDHRGHIFALYSRPDHSPALVEFDDKGEKIAERPFEQPGKVDWTDVARIGDGRFFVSRAHDKDAEESKNNIWLAELTTGKEEPLGIRFPGWIDGISRFKDGGFVILDSMIRQSMGVDRLTCYEKDGSTRWTIESTDRAGHEIVFGGRDVAVLSDERIAVLGSTSVRILNRDGDLTQTIDLVGAFGHEQFGGRPGYLSEIIADRDGGFILRNFRNPPVVLRYDREGEIQDRWSPRHPDGRTFDIRPGIRVAPDGRLWTSDEHAIMRLTQEGVVDQFIGEPPSADVLESIVGFTVGYDGKMYAVAGGTGAVHVFSPSGEFLKVLEPKPTDFAGTVKEAFVAVTDRGDVYVQRPSTQVYMAPDEYLHFNPAGEPVEIVTFSPRLATTTFGPGWAFQPGTGHRCGFCQVGGDERLVIMTPENKIIKEARKRPNGKWFSFVSGFAMSPMGSIAVLSSELGGDRKVSELDLFSAAGEPVKTIELPRARSGYLALAHAGERVIVVAREELLIVDLATEAISRWSLEEPPVTPKKWQPFIASGGRELLLYDPQMFGAHPAAVHRYQLP